MEKTHLGFAEFAAINEEFANRKDFKIGIYLKPYNSEAQAKTIADKLTKSHKLKSITTELSNKQNDTYTVYAVCPDIMTFKALQKEQSVQKVVSL